MSEPFLGQITVFPYPFPPKGWADCAGQLLPIAQNTALFSLLGTNFGGDGRVTFGLPDLRGRVPVGMGTSQSGTSYGLGEMGGGENVTLIGTEMPVHSHSLNATQAQGTVNTAAGNLLASVFVGDLEGSDRGDVYNPGSGNTTLQPASIGLSGSSQPHNNIQPSLVLRYCIALSGIFPQRS